MPDNHKSSLLALSVLAAALPVAATDGLESLRKAADAPAASTFDGSRQRRTLTAADRAQLKGAPPLSKGPEHHFEGTQPLNGITIYTPVAGEGANTAGESPTAKYGEYGKYAMGGGAALIGLGIALGGTPLVALAAVGGLLIGGGAVLSFLFGKKK